MARADGVDRPVDDGAIAIGRARRTSRSADSVPARRCWRTVSASTATRSVSTTPRRRASSACDIERRSAPPSSTLPQSAGCILAIVRSSVDLPMPFGPSRHTSSPESHRQVDVLEHGAARPARAIADRQIARAQARRRTARGRRTQRRRHPANAPRRLRSSTATTTGAPMQRRHGVERQHAGAARQQRHDLRDQRDGAAHQHDRRHEHPMIRRAEQAAAEMRHGDAEKRDRSAERRDHRAEHRRAQHRQEPRAPHRQPHRSRVVLAEQQRVQLLGRRRRRSARPTAISGPNSRSRCQVTPENDPNPHCAHCCSRSGWLAPTSTVTTADTA